MKKLFSILTMAAVTFAFSTSANADSFTTAFFDQYVADYIADNPGVNGPEIYDALDVQYGIGFGVPTFGTDADGDLIVLEALIRDAPNNTTFQDFINFIETQDDDLDAVFNEDTGSFFNSYWEVFSLGGSGTQIPIDGGLGFLAVAGVAYGIRRFKK